MEMPLAELGSGKGWFVEVVVKEVDVVDDVVDVVDVVDVFGSQIQTAMNIVKVCNSFFIKS